MLRVSYGQNQGVGQAGVLPGSSQKEFLSRFFPVAPRIQFLAAVGLSVCLGCYNRKP